MTQFVKRLLSVSLFFVFPLSNLFVQDSFSATDTPRAVLLTTYSKISESVLEKVGVVLKVSQDELIILTSSEDIVGFDSRIVLNTYGQSPENWLEPAHIQIDAAKSRWVISDDLAWLPLSGTMSRTGEEKIDNIAVPVSPHNFDPAQSRLFVHTFLRLFDGLPLPVIVSTRLSISGESFDSNDVVSFVNASNFAGSPVFYELPNSDETLFCGILTGGDGDNATFIESMKIMQAIRGDAIAEPNLAKLSTKLYSSKSIIIQDNMKLFVINEGSDFYLVCPTMALAKGLHPGSTSRETENTSHNLIAFINSGKLSWTHTEYAISVCCVESQEISLELCNYLKDVSFKTSDGPLELTSHHFFLSSPAGSRKHSVNFLKECQVLPPMGSTPTALGSITYGEERISIGEPVLLKGESVSLQVVGVVVSSVSYPNIELGFKDVTCGARFVSIFSLIPSLKKTVTLKQPDVVTRGTFADKLRCSHCQCLFEKNKINASIVKWQDSYFVIGARHAFSNTVPEKLLLRFPVKEKAAFFIRYEDLEVSNCKWFFDKSDTAILPLDLSNMDASETLLIENASIDLSAVNAGAENSKIESLEDLYIINNWEDQHFLYKNVAVTAMFPDIGSSEQLVFASYPGLLKGASGSAVFKMRDGNPVFAGIVSSGIMQGDRVIATLILTAEEIIDAIGRQSEPVIFLHESSEVSE